MASEPNGQPAGRPAEPLLPRRARDVLLGLVALFVLIAFVFVYLIVFACSLQVTWLCRSTNLDDPQILSAATGLTGLVGGVVAVALAQSQDQRPTSNGNGGGSNGNGTPPSGSATGTRLSRIPGGSGKVLLAVLYTFVYAAFGLAALVVWIFDTDNASDALKALASVALGLLLPIVRSYFVPGE